MTKEDAELKISVEACLLKQWYGTRHTQAIMLFLINCIEFGMRVNLTVGIVAMTAKSSSNPDVPIYNWTDQYVVLSSYYWGYVLPQIVAGQLVRRFGAKWFLLLTALGGSLFGIIIPVLASFGSWTVMVCRVLQGFCHGFLCPCCHNMLAKWVPKNEKTRLNTFVYAGGPLGVVISMPLTGWICGSWLGWPYSFYVHGAVGLLWSLVWTFLGKSCPADHTGISLEEKEFIEKSVGISGRSDKSETPWKSICTSLPVWAILISSCGQIWGFTTLLTGIPTYMANVLHYNIQGNGLISAGPFLLFWILSFAFSYVTDYCITREIVSTGAARKTVNGVALYTPGVALLVLASISRLESDITNIILVIFFITVGISSGFLCGHNVNHIDLSPVHAGALMGITNSIGNVCAIIAPLAVQFIVTDSSDPTQWAVVFYISSAIFIVCTTFYIIFASGETQPWNNSTPHIQENDNKDNGYEL